MARSAGLVADARRRQQQALKDRQQQTGSEHEGLCWLPAGVIVGILLAVVGLPGFAPVWAGTMVWLSVHQPPVLSKKQDGQPVPAGDQEQMLWHRYQMVRRVRRHAGVLSRAWFPGWPPRGTWIAAALEGVLAGMVPAAWGWVRLVNGVAVFTLATGLQAASRSAGLDTPGLRVSALPASFRGRHGISQVVSTIAGAAAAVAAVWAIGRLLAPTVAGWRAAGWVWLSGHAGWLTGQIPAAMAAPAAVSGWWWLGVAAVSGAVAGCWRGWLQAGLADWHTGQQTGRVWADRFAQLKLDPPPRLVSHRQVGQAIVDTFEAPPAKGAADMLRLTDKLAPFTHPGRPVVLEHAQSGPDGQPMLGTVSPTWFRIVCWNQQPDIADPSLSDAEAWLWLESCAAWAADAVGLGHPLLTGLRPLSHHPQPPPRSSRLARFVRRARPARNVNSKSRSDGDGNDNADIGDTDDGIDLGDDADGDRDDGDSGGCGRLHDLLPHNDTGDTSNGPDESDSADGSAAADGGSPVRVWQTEWVWQQMDAAGARSSWRDPMAAELGHPVLVDHRADLVYAGPAADDQLILADPADGEAMARIRTEDWWRTIWAGIQKHDTNPPTIEHNAYLEAKLTADPDGPVVYAQPFIVRQTEDPAEFFGLEAKLATGIQQTSFVHVLGWPDSNRRAGMRHPQAFVVAWSHAPMPTIEQLPGTGDPEAARIVLSAHVAQAFTDHRMNQPELVDVERLTRPGQPGIWKISLRLYGKTTLETLRKQAEPMRASLDTAWLRIVAGDDGLITLIAGADPAAGQVRLSPAVRAETASYDVQHAFSMAGCFGNGGALPSVDEAGPLPGNRQVTMMRLRVPAGLTPAMMRQAQDKLRPALGKTWIEIEPVPDNPRQAQMMTADQDPLPTVADYPFDIRLGARRVGLGVDLAGQPVAADIDQVAHMIVAGASGSGKSGSARALLAGALLAGGRVVVVDEGGQGVDYEFARPWLAGMATHVLQAEAMLQAVVADGEQRLQAMTAAGVDHAAKLAEPAAVPPLFVFVDELMVLIGSDHAKPASQPEPDPEMEAARLAEVAEYQARRRIAALLGQITRQLRKCDVHMVAVNQVFKQDMLPRTLTDLKTNSTRILLGAAPWPDRQSTLANPELAPEIGTPAPRGRAIWESMQDATKIVQMWFAEPDIYHAELADQLPQLDEAQKFDWQTYQRQVATSEFQILDDTTSDDGDRDGDGVDNDQDVDVVEELDWTNLAPPDNDNNSNSHSGSNDCDSLRQDSDSGPVAVPDRTAEPDHDDTPVGAYVTNVTPTPVRPGRPGEGQSIATLTSTPDQQ